MRNRLFRALTLPAALATGGLLASCGGGGTGSPDMVLVSFNLPNIAGVALNQPLVYTFSDNVDPLSVTPDTLQVSGSPSFTFESIVVDGNLVAELPFIPNFDDYSDSGLAPGRTYNVFLPTFPAVDTIRSTSGRPLVLAESFSFTTLPTFSFIEARRPLVHEPGPISGPNLFGDEDGCIQNPGNILYTFPGFQFGTDADARLLCIANEGAPHVFNDSSKPLQSSNPFHDKRAVGTASATAPGTLDLGAMRIRFNEPLDPVSVTPYVPTTQFSLNVQLWRVGDGDAVPLATPIQVKTTAPRVVQDLTRIEVILVPTGPEAQGTYLLNIQGVKDLAGNLVATSDRPDPAPGGYAAIETAIVGKIAPGYRIYFRTLELPLTPNSITENFGNNASEGTSSLFTFSTPGSAAGNLTNAIPTSPAAAGPGFVLIQSQPGQATVANWNDAYRFLGTTGSGRPNVRANTAVDDGAGRLKATYAPYMGNGDDLSFNLLAGSTSLRTDGQDDFNNDGVFEFQDFFLASGATLTLSGSRPALILVRGSCTINGTIVCNGSTGRFGIETDGTGLYTGAGAIEPSGLGGLGGPGGGNGGRGAPGLVLPNAGDGVSGSAGVNVLGDAVTASGGGFGAFGDGTNQGGGGGGYGTAGSGGSGATNGATSGLADFTRALASFAPERCFQPNADLAGGAGGGGGGIDDDNGTSETGDGMIPVTAPGSALLAGGDDAGAGGGGGGGAVWFIADTIDVGGSILCDGGAGGNTYNSSGQVFSGGVVIGVADDTSIAPAVLGGGGGGGGGSGGAILLQARTSLTLQSGAVLSAVGGADGRSTLSSGGAGGDGRIALMTFAGSAESAGAGAPVDLGASVTPAAGVSSATWLPTVDLTSQGVSNWIDFVTNVTTFSAPFWDDNFLTLTSLGLVQGAGQDFNAILEFQGADTLTPNPTTPTGGTVVTAWTTNLLSLNNKVFVRWRWRFFVNRADVSPMNDPDFDPLVHPMPQVIDFTIPFTK